MYSRPSFCRGSPATTQGLSRKDMSSAGVDDQHRKTDTFEGCETNAPPPRSAPARLTAPPADGTPPPLARPTARPPMGKTAAAGPCAGPSEKPPSRPANAARALDRPPVLPPTRPQAAPAAHALGRPPPPDDPRLTDHHRGLTTPPCTDPNPGRLQPGAGTRSLRPLRLGSRCIALFRVGAQARRRSTRLGVPRSHRRVAPVAPPCLPGPHQRPKWSVVWVPMRDCHASSNCVFALRTLTVLISPRCVPV